MKRAVIFFLLKGDAGLGSTRLLLSSLQGVCDRILIVSQGPVPEEAKVVLAPLASSVDEVGGDSASRPSFFRHYAYGLTSLLQTSAPDEWDEVVFMHSFQFGPFHPWEGFFQTMEGKACDYWLLKDWVLQETNRGKHERKVTTDRQKPVFSNFNIFALRRKALSEGVFLNVWRRGISAGLSDNDMILKLLRLLERSSLVRGGFIPERKYEGNADDPSLYCAIDMLEEDHCPVLDKEVFAAPTRRWLARSTCHTAVDVLQYVDKHTDYDVQLIWENLIRTIRMSDLRSNLHLNYFLPRDVRLSAEKSSADVALVLFVYYEDLLDYCVGYARSMPSGSTIYVVSAKESLMDAYKEALAGDDYTVHCRKMVNWGRDVAAYLVAAADAYAEHDYLCLMHDKKTKHIKDSLIGKEFCYHCFENNLSTPEFVDNVVRTFDLNPRLGMLVPPPMCYGTYLSLMDDGIGVNKDGMLETIKLLGIEVPYDEAVVAPYGTMFWVRGAAFRETMFRHKWEYDDFPHEPIRTDGTILHVLERIYPLAAQNDGFYVGWLATDRYASAYMDCYVGMMQGVVDAIKGKGMPISLATSSPSLPPPPPCPQSCPPVAGDL